MKLDKGKEFWQRLNVSGSQKKYILTLLVLAMIGAGAIILGNVLAPEAPRGQAVPTEEHLREAKGGDGTASALAQEEERLADDLTQVLSCVEGVGRVRVKVSLQSTAQTAYATENQVSTTKTSEGLQSGGSRTTEENRQEDKLAMQSKSSGISQPVVITEARPQAVGVIVVAEGAGDLAVREQIAGAVQVLLDIPAHKVTVLPMERVEK